MKVFASKVISALAFGVLVNGCFAAQFTSLSSETIHLGSGRPEWSIFEGRPLHGAEFRLKFQFQANDREHTLVIRQDDVKQDWSVVLNGEKLGELFLMEADLIHMLAIPPNTLRDGENELHISTKTPEDILISSLAIADDAHTNIFPEARLRVTVSDEHGAPIPSRLTVTDENGTLAALGSGDTNIVVRPGVVYTANGAAEISLLPGKYTVSATRGPEYSIEREDVMMGEEDATLHFELRREVNTTNWVAADTHIHTLSLSKHGDALLHERMITLAAEGIELPIATEHNLHADYTPAAKSLGLEKQFTVVSGNEVTTKRGHFNIFPVSLKSKPADHSLEHWRDLMKNIRQSRDVRVIILNHPTDTHAGFTPFASTNFNRLTGKNLRGDFDFEFDAVEVINSGAMRSDWMEPFRCWFALLNRGHRITGVGASDSHDVSRFIVGQGRTYIRGADTNVSRLDVAQLSENLKQGRAIVSLGLFPQLTISDAPDALDAPSLVSGVIDPGSSAPGDLHQGESRFFEVTGSVDFPVWINPEGRTVATLYENGQPKLVFPFEMKKSAGKPLAFKARFPKPKADAWYVLIAETPGVTNSYWSIARPYHPSSPEWKPAMIGATNPIYLDANGDGLYTSPRQTAEYVNEQYVSPHDLIPALAQYDWSVAVQAAEVLSEAGVDLKSAELRPTLAKAAPHVQQAFNDYISTLSK